MLLLLVFVCVIACIVQICVVHAPDLVWSIAYSHELQEIYNRFVTECHIPSIPPNWFDDIQTNHTYQVMRKETQTIPETKYDDYETKPMGETQWAHDIKVFYSNKYMIEHPIDVDALFVQPRDAPVYNCTRHNYYVPRLGHFTRHVTHELESFARNKIQDLMQRLELKDDSSIAHSRIMSYTPPGGFIECQSNRYQPGWRYEMHYMPHRNEATNPQDSSLYYRHVHDRSIRRVNFTNTHATLFRSRFPKPLWHSSISESGCFSWCIYLPSSLAHALCSQMCLVDA